MEKKSSTDDQLMSLEVLHPNAAGIDIGNAAHYVAVPPDRDTEPVRTLACFTQDVRALARCLPYKACAIPYDGVKSIAREYPCSASVHCQPQLSLNFPRTMVLSLLKGSILAALSSSLKARPEALPDSVSCPISAAVHQKAL